MVQKLKALQRLLIFRRIRKEHKRKIAHEVNLLKEAMKYMDKWNDIPMSDLMPTLCQDMNIQMSKSARIMFHHLYNHREQKEFEMYAEVLVEARAKFNIRYISYEELARQNRVSKSFC